jgi:hypothetical protein
MHFDLVDFAYRTRQGYFRRQIVNLADLPSLISKHAHNETFASVFTYPPEILNYAEKNRINGKPSISGYKGEVQAKIGSVFDIDANGEIEKALTTARELFDYFVNKLGLPQEAIGCFFSGNKGFHLYPDARVWEAKPGRKLDQIFKNLRETIVKQAQLSYPETIDHACGNKISLLRLPNSINFKSGLYKVQLTPYELYEFSMEEIKEKARQRQEMSSFFDKTGLNSGWTEVIPRAKEMYEYVEKKLRKKPGIRLRAETRVTRLCPAIKNIINQGFPCGERDEVALRIASALNLSNYPREEAHKIMLGWNSRNDQSKEPFMNRELLRIIDYIYRRGGYKFSCRDALIRRYCPYGNRRLCPFLKIEEVRISETG